MFKFSSVEEQTFTPQMHNCSTPEEEDCAGGWMGCGGGCRLGKWKVPEMYELALLGSGGRPCWRACSLRLPDFSMTDAGLSFNSEIPPLPSFPLPSLLLLPCLSFPFLSFFLFFSIPFFSSDSEAQIKKT